MMTTETPHFAGPCIPQRAAGERVLIRPTTRADLPYLQRWWNDPAVTGPAGNVDGMQYDDSDMDAWYVRYIAHQTTAHHFMICLNAGARPIGEFYIADDDRPGCVSFALLIGEVPLWGQGYGREAVIAYARQLFGTTPCNAMRIEVRRSNTRVLRWCESLGFTVEHEWANGRLVTLVLNKAAFETRYGPVQAG